MIPSTKERAADVLRDRLTTYASYDSRELCIQAFTTNFFLSSEKSLCDEGYCF